MSDDAYSIVDAVTQAMMSIDVNSSLLRDKLLDRDLRMVEKQKRVDALEAKLLKQSEKIKNLSAELKHNCETKLRDDAAALSNARKQKLDKKPHGNEGSSAKNLSNTGKSRLTVNEHGSTTSINKSYAKSMYLAPKLTKIPHPSPMPPMEDVKAAHVSDSSKSPRTERRERNVTQHSLLVKSSNC